MVEVLLVVGVGVAMFVGFNIGGSSTGVAFGPAVGSGVLSKVTAGALMSIFFLAGGAIVGPNVVSTMGGDIVPERHFSLAASVGILFFVGGALLVANSFGVPASTSMTAVSSIVGLGMAVGDVNWDVFGRIVAWWIVAPVLAFWIGGVIGRYIYPWLDARFALESSDGPLLTVDRSRPVPRPTLGPGTTGREFVGSVVILAIACYSAFSAGASNVANAVAPLVGSGELSMTGGVVVACSAVAVGAFTIARRTLDTVGSDLTDLPLLAALIVATVASSLTTFLSYIGIPVSLALSAVMCIVGLGWGRATRVTTISQAVRGEKEVPVTTRALTIEEEAEKPRAIGEEEPEDVLDASDLYDPTATGRVIALWIFTPGSAVTLSYLFFTAVFTLV